MSKTPIQLSDHFTCRKLICFTLPSITMIIFTAIYGVVDGFFVSNYAGKTPFAAVNLIIPVLLSSPDVHPGPASFPYSWWKKGRK